MKKFPVLCVFFVLACSPKFKDITLNDHFRESISETSEIIATQFKEEGIDSAQVVFLNDPRYKNAYLLNESIYSDYDQVNRLIGNLKLSSGKDYKLSIIQDTGKIKQLFEKYKTVYSGQDRLVNWKIIN